MRSANQHHTRRSTRGRLCATAAACALLGAAGLLSGGAASASAGTPRGNGAGVQAALRHDLRQYLTAERKAEHISAVSLRVSFPASKPSIDLATGTTRYDGGPPVSTRALWQIGSNTKAFTAIWGPADAEMGGQGVACVGDGPLVRNADTAGWWSASRARRSFAGRAPGHTGISHPGEPGVP
jgi:hypothetical protein